MANDRKERKQAILETLAKLLESPKSKKITTALLAEEMDVSEAALYRHFASKAQMYEGLIEFIEQSLFGIINKISAEESDGISQARRIISVLLLFADKNPGMTRVLIGDALVNEDPRLQLRINQLFDRIESTLKQSLRISETQSNDKLDPESRANLMLCFVIGRWQQYAKSGFKRSPMEFAQAQLGMLV